MITTRQARALRRRIDSFEGAVRADARKGVGYPDDIPIVEKELRDARRQLDQYIMKLIKRYLT